MKDLLCYVCDYMWFCHWFFNAITAMCSVPYRSAKNPSSSFKLRGTLPIGWKGCVLKSSRFRIMKVTLMLIMSDTDPQQETILCYKKVKRMRFCRWWRGWWCLWWWWWWWWWWGGGGWWWWWWGWGWGWWIIIWWDDHDEEEETYDDDDDDDE